MDELIVNGTPIPVASWQPVGANLDTQQRASDGTMRSAKRGDDVRRYRASGTTDVLTDSEGSDLLDDLLGTADLTLGGLLITDLLGAAILARTIGNPGLVTLEGEAGVQVSFEVEQVGVA